MEESTEGLGRLVRKKESMLEDIAKGANSHKGIKKLWDYTKGIYIGGVLREKHQRKFAEKIGWSSSKLTFYNIGIFGTLGTLEYFIVGKEGGHAVSFISDQLDIAPQVLGYGLFAWNTCQSLFRIAYVLKHKKGIASFSIEGGIVSLGYWLYNKLKF